MFERFTDKGRKIIILAREEAERHQNDYLGTEHLVLAILRESDGIALMILKKMGLSTEQVRLEIERNLPGGGTTMTFGEIPFSPRVKKVIEYGVEEARLLGHNHIGSEHLLLGLLREEEGIGGKILRSLGANLLTARQLTVTFLRKSAPRERDRKSNTPALDEFGRDLTQLAQAGQLDPSHRPSRRNRAGASDPEPPLEKQSRAYRGSRRRQDRHCRRSCPTNHPVRSAG